MPDPERTLADPRLPGPAPEVVRQLVVCCDGTNNTLTGGQRDTNVLRLFELLAGAAANQRLYYDPGVGAPDGLPATGLLEPLTQMVERAVSLAIGRGIYENIGQAYLFLCREYRAGDQVYLFGFSRGAFTVRCVAGMVNMFGLLRAEHEPLLATLLRIYFAAAEDNLDPLERMFQRVRLGMRGGRRPATRDELADQVRRAFTSDDGREALVHFTGVWDTVESVGIRGFRKSISNKSLLGTKPYMVHARHALSLDEHRYAFLPRYYTDRAPLRPDQTLAQVWFRGVHSDVGGGAGFPEQSGLSFVALDWMVDEARAAGLRCTPTAAREPAPSARLHDQLHSTPWWAVAGMALRNPADAPGGNVNGLTLAAPSEHPSVAARAPDTLWAQWRSWGWLAFALAWCGVWLVLSGAQMLPSIARVRVFDPSTWSQAMAAVGAGGELAWMQFAALWRPESAWRAVSDAAMRGAAPRAALLLDGLFIAGYAYLFARLSSRAFAWLARWHRVGDAMPRWNQLQLGRALPLMLLGDAVENLFGLAAWSLDDVRWGASLLWIGSLGSAAKWAGLAGVLLLALLGWRGRRHPQRQATSPGAGSPARS
jgi:uncharacterized protein (DUF2235 family)